MDRKLDAILNKLKTVSTKDDMRAVNGRIDGIEERLSKLERRRDPGAVPSRVMREARRKIPPGRQEKNNPPRG